MLTGKISDVIFCILKIQIIFGHRTQSCRGCSSWLFIYLFLWFLCQIMVMYLFSACQVTLSQVSQTKILLLPFICKIFRITKDFSIKSYNSIVSCKLAFERNKGLFKLCDWIRRSIKKIMPLGRWWNAMMVKWQFAIKINPNERTKMEVNFSSYSYSYWLCSKCSSNCRWNKLIRLFTNISLLL